MHIFVDTTFCIQKIVFAFFFYTTESGFIGHFWDMVRCFWYKYKWTSFVAYDNQLWDRYNPWEHIINMIRFSEALNIGRTIDYTETNISIRYYDTTNNVVL